MIHLNQYSMVFKRMTPDGEVLRNEVISDRDRDTAILHGFKYAAVHEKCTEDELELIECKCRKRRR